MSAAVLVLLAIFIMSGLAAFRESSALDQAVDETLELLREARSKTLASESALSYGVHFAASRVTLFPGGVYGAGDPANVVLTLPPPLTISSINLGTTTGNVVFERLSGTSPASGTITFTTARSSRTKQIQILPSGLFLKL